MLELQLGKLTPYPRGEILSGWATVGSFREGYTSVLLAIGRKTAIDDVLHLLKSKGMAPQWVGVSSEGLGAWWAIASKRVPAAPAGQLTALIDVDATSTDCVIFSNGRLLFSHSVPIGAEQLSAAEPAKLRWAGELVRLPRILAHEDVKGQVGRAVVTGLTEGLGPLIDQLSSQWGVPVDVALEGLLRRDPRVDLRQVHGIDASGVQFVHTGAECVLWAGHLTGPNHSVAGNMLVGEATITAMSREFAATEGSGLDFAERLLMALEAGQLAGGDKRGKQSAALLVASPEPRFYHNLRVDDHPAPVVELRRIFDLARKGDVERRARYVQQRAEFRVKW